MRPNAAEIYIPAAGHRFEHIATACLFKTGKIGRFRSTQIDRRDAPPQIPRLIHVVIDIKCLMGPMKGAKTQMHNADFAI